MNNLLILYVLGLFAYPANLQTNLSESSDINISCSKHRIYYYRGRDIFGETILIGKKRVINLNVIFNNDSIFNLPDSLFEKNLRIIFYDEMGTKVYKGVFARWQNSEFMNFKPMPEKARDNDKITFKRKKGNKLKVAFPLISKYNNKFNGSITGFKFKKRGYFKFKVILNLASGKVLESNELIIYIH